MTSELLTSLGGRPFLVGGWSQGIILMPCPTVGFNALLDATCSSNVVLADVPAGPGVLGLLDLHGKQVPSAGRVVLRAHNNDPLAATCPADALAECRSWLVIDDVVWTPTSSPTPSAGNSSAPVETPVPSGSPAPPSSQVPPPAATALPSDGISADQAVAIARTHLDPSMVLLSTTAGTFGSLKPPGTGPGIGVSDDRFVWAVTFSGSFNVCAPTTAPNGSNPCDTRHGTATVFLDYGSGDYLMSSSQA